MAQRTIANTTALGHAFELLTMPAAGCRDSVYGAFMPKKRSAAKEGGVEERQ
ncbi:hypothetical protein [Candidatus Pandoraea novymonadis]|uniref:hypothetical protein n=1 Tax=Candidatus Pandoraea novymonadis TaxID=1808959 RepID=UPI0015E6422F|nr:hypothetical protein [Candidatus Pandoraea novymonadis]